MFYRGRALDGMGPRRGDDGWLRVRNRARQCAEPSDALSVRRWRNWILPRADYPWSETRTKVTRQCAAAVACVADRMAHIAVFLSGPGSADPTGRIAWSDIFRSLRFDRRHARSGRVVFPGEMARRT